MNAMWKPNQPGTSPTSPSDPIRPQTLAPLSPEPVAQRPNPTPSSSTSEQATIGKSLTIKGEITGSEMLYIDG
ncbi:MAG: polymer-forming cytoskeletal protein, partial [Acidobacteriaceae bacterium]